MTECSRIVFPKTKITVFHVAIPTYISLLKYIFPFIILQFRIKFTNSQTDRTAGDNEIRLT